MKEYVEEQKRKNKEKLEWMTKTFKSNMLEGKEDTKYCIFENDNPKVALCVCKYKPCHKQLKEMEDEKR